MGLVEPLLEVGYGVKGLQAQHVGPAGLRVEGMGQEPAVGYLVLSSCTFNQSFPFYAGGGGLPNGACVLTLCCHCDSPFCYPSSFPFAPRQEFLGTHGLQQQPSRREVIQSLEGC